MLAAGLLVSENRDALVDDDLVRLRQRAVAATLRGKIDDDRTGRHAVDHLLRDENRRLFSWYQRGGDDHVAPGDDPQHHFPLAPVERLVLRLRIAPLVLGIASVERHLHETRAQALHLLLDGRPYVVRFHFRAQPTGSGDRLQAGNAGANDEDFGGGEGAGGRHQHRKHPGQRVGREQHSFVSSDGCHGRQRVHALRPGDPRHELHRQCRGAGLRDRADRVGRSERIGEADHRLAGPQQGELRWNGPNLQDDVGGREDFGPCGHLRAGLHVSGIGKSRWCSGPLLDDHVEAGFFQEGDARRNQRDPGFPRPGLFRSSHSHGTPV